MFYLQLQLLGYFVDKSWTNKDSHFLIKFLFQQILHVSSPKLADFIFLTI